MLGCTAWSKTWQNTKLEYRALHPARQVVVLLFLAFAVWYLNWLAANFFVAAV
jgi:hypothetical protein